MSRRLANQNPSQRIEERAINQVATRNLSGTNLTSQNSFSALDDDIMSRALEFGIDNNSITLEKINMLKDLEIARHALAEKVVTVEEESHEQEGTVEEESHEQEGTVELLGWKDEGEKDGFTPVISRRTKKELRKSGDGNLLAAQSGCSAAAVKVNNYHPLCGVVTGTRVRRKKSKYL
jgi:hypothetical protein